MVRRGPSDEMTFEQRPVGSNRVSVWITGGKSIPGRGKSERKGPEAGGGEAGQKASGAEDVQGKALPQHSTCCRNWSTNHPFSGLVSEPCLVALTV